MNMRRRWTVVATIQVALMALTAVAAEPKTITLPKGTHVEKVAAGHCRFWLPDGKVVQLKEFDPATGKVGDVGIFNAAGVRAIAGEKAKLTPIGTLTKEEAAKLPVAEFVEVDSVMIRLPATLEYEVKTDPPPAMPAPPEHGAPTRPPGAP